MAAALMRQARISKVLPVAVAQGWPVRRFAREARISYGAAGETLRAVQQRTATDLDGETASLCAASAAAIREGVGRAVAGLVKRVEVEAADLAKGLDPAGVERLLRAMEATLRVADNLDGLGHLRRLEEGFARRVDGEQVASLLDGRARSSGREFEGASVDVLLGEHKRESDRAVVDDARDS